MKLFKRFKLKKGKEELNSTGGNYICGQMIPEEALEQIPENFQPRRKDAIGDRSVLMTLIGMLCNSRTDFNDVNLYQGDTIFAHSFHISQLPSEASLRQRLDELPEQLSHSALRGFNQTLLKVLPMSVLFPAYFWKRKKGHVVMFIIFNFLHSVSSMLALRVRG